MRVIKYIIPFVFITLVYGCSRRVIPDTVTEVRDTVIYIPADTVYNTINIKELCDTLYKRDTVIVKKRGRVNNIITIKNDTIRFSCSEDSLRLVIETMRKTQTVTKPNQWTPTHILLLLFLIAVIIGAVSNLFRK
jgi:hypothetical protein